MLVIIGYASVVLCGMVNRKSWVSNFKLFSYLFVVVDHHPGQN